MSDKKAKDTDLTKEEWQDVRDEAEFIATYKGWKFSDAMKEAEERIRKAVNKVKE